jgi:threonine/homoserine/homoserine lactone efflux protein
MKTGFGIFMVGIMLIVGGLLDPLPDVLTVIVGIAGVFLSWAGAKLMKGRGSLVDNPTLW